MHGPGGFCCNLQSTRSVAATTLLSLLIELLHDPADGICQRGPPVDSSTPTYSMLRVCCANGTFSRDFCLCLSNVKHNRHVRDVKRAACKCLCSMHKVRSRWESEQIKCYYGLLAACDRNRMLSIQCIALCRRRYHVRSVGVCVCFVPFIPASVHLGGATLQTIETISRSPVL